LVRKAFSDMLIASAACLLEWRLQSSHLVLCLAARSIRELSLRQMITTTFFIIQRKLLIQNKSH